MELRCPWPVRCVAHCVTQRFSLCRACASATGVIGDATRASAELGRRLWDEVISTTAGIFRDVVA